jgi:transposase
MDEQPRLPDAIRVSLPPSVQADLAHQDAQIASLREHVDAMPEHIGSLQAQLSKLQLQLADATGRKPPHAGNSSRPPSSDPPDAPACPRRPPSGRKRGGQRGHPGHQRRQLGDEELTAIVPHRPQQCPACTFPLADDLPTEGNPQRMQVWEIPPIQPEVTEHRGYAVRCPHGDVLVPAPDLPVSAVGPRLAAMGSLLHGRYRLSVRETAGVFDDLLGVPVGIGSINGLCQEVSAAVAEPDEAAREAGHEQKVANVDETGWKHAGKRRWLWGAVTALCTVFLVTQSRSAKVLAAVLGEDVTGLVGSDRYRAYRSIPTERRQVCWAHLKRDLAAFAERGGSVGDWGKEGIGLVAKIFAAGYRFKDGTRDRRGLQAEIAPLRHDFRAFLERATEAPSWKVRGFSADLRKLESALGTFASVAGVEPTNNAAERALRPAVFWRKGCFGADSDDGTQFVARILTVPATCRQQHRPLLGYLTEAVVAHRLGRSAPALLPTP